MSRMSLRAARVDRGLSQQQFGDAVGVSKSTVISWESGKTLPNLDKVSKICEVLGREYDEIRWGA